MLRQITCLIGTTVFVAAVAGACSKSPASVCEDLCAKMEECGNNCSCNANDYSDCPNESAILDHLEGCSEKSCGEVGGCIMSTPSCDGSSNTGSSVTGSTVASTSASTGGGGGPCALLAAKCGNCTTPGLAATCAAAVATDDPASCQDGLDDPEIQANCN